MLSLHSALSSQWAIIGHNSQVLCTWSTRRVLAIDMLYSSSFFFSQYGYITEIIIVLFDSGRFHTFWELLFVAESSESTPVEIILPGFPLSPGRNITQRWHTSTAEVRSVCYSKIKKTPETSPIPAMYNSHEKLNDNLSSKQRVHGRQLPQSWLFLVPTKPQKPQAIT